MRDGGGILFDNKRLGHLSNICQSIWSRIYMKNFIVSRIAVEITSPGFDLCGFIDSSFFY